MLDTFNREINYLRISVTDLCNLRCTYCMPESGINLKKHTDILSFEEIVLIVKSAVKQGIVKIRLTGGEPLVRKNIEELVRLIKEVDGVKELVMTTNGTLLIKKAHSLKANGVDRLNISLDTLDSQKYSDITRGGNVNDVINGIKSAKEVGFNNIKINMVVGLDTLKSEVEEMQNFCKDNGLLLQKISRFSLVDREDVSNAFESERPAKCINCNRIRLTADKQLLPCLFSNEKIKVDFTDIDSSIRETIILKPENGTICENRNMSAIGG